MDENDEQEKRKTVAPRKAIDNHRYKIDKLMKNPEKPVFIPEPKEVKEPRVFRPPEFIRNIWGSSAGVGSGDFHIYRNMRRRQYAREKHMDKMSEQEKLDFQFQERLHGNKLKCAEKADKKKLKRQKKKQKQNAKKSKKEDEEKDETESESEEEEQEEIVSFQPNNQPIVSQSSTQSSEKLADTDTSNEPNSDSITVKSPQNTDVKNLTANSDLCAPSDLSSKVNDGSNAETSS